MARWRRVRADRRDRAPTSRRWSTPGTRSACSARSPTATSCPTTTSAGRRCRASPWPTRSRRWAAGRSPASTPADRNVLGFRRDLLTAAAYGVDEFLLVYGDRPDVGRRSDDVSVRRMIEEIRTFGVERCVRRLPAVPRRGVDAADARGAVQGRCRLPRRPGVPRARRPRPVARLGHVRRADHAGVMVVASAAMARKLGAESPQLAVPQWLVDAVDADRMAGVEAACKLAQRSATRRLRRRPPRRGGPLP